VVDVDGSNIVINVNGVGYSVVASQDALARSRNGEEITLFIYTNVKEDSIELYGFLGKLDLKLFKNLITVSGVGPRTAIKIFAVGSRNEIVQAIVTGDASFFESVPRLGRKNAQKIIIELKNKFEEIEDFDMSDNGSKENSEVVKALEGFGFSRKEAIEGLKLVKDTDKSVEEKIKLVLKEMGK